MPQFFEFYNIIDRVNGNIIYVFPVRMHKLHYVVALITDKSGEYSSYENSEGWTISMRLNPQMLKGEDIIETNRIPRKRDFIHKLFYFSNEVRG